MGCMVIENVPVDKIELGRKIKVFFIILSCYNNVKEVFPWEYAFQRDNGWSCWISKDNAMLHANEEHCISIDDALRRTATQMRVQSQSNVESIAETQIRRRNTQLKC